MHILENIVSVPIRGLFNLTKMEFKELLSIGRDLSFRPHQGII